METVMSEEKEDADKRESVQTREKQNTCREKEEGGEEYWCDFSSHQWGRRGRIVQKTRHLC